MSATIYGGTSNPKIMWSSNVINLPHPQKFEPVFKPEKIVNELADGNTNYELTGYRYYVKLGWESLNDGVDSSSDDYQALFEILNYLGNGTDRTVKFWPHADSDFYVDVMLDSNIEMPIGISEKNKTGIGHELEISFKSKELLGALPFGWVSPNRYSDLSNKWTDEAKAVDEINTTYAVSDSVASGDYTGVFRFYFRDNVLANKLRFKVYSTVEFTLDIDASIDGAAVSLLFDTVTYSTFVEVTFSPGNVEHIDIRARNNSGGAATIRLYELDIRLV